jgi:hypothetical protein
MKCPVCDVLLTDGECVECRELSEALSALREEQLPPLVVKTPRRGRVVYPSIAAGIAAAAAAGVLMLALPHLRRPETAPALKSTPPPIMSAPEVPPAKSEPLKIKILTPDPNVVIYWLVQPKEGE